MIFTARQLQDLQGKSPATNDQIVLPCGARLTPLALDWARGKRLKIGYGPAEMSPNRKTCQSAAIPRPKRRRGRSGHLLWWCDGPCKRAKAAFSRASEPNRASPPIDLPSAPTQLTSAIKRLASGR